MMLLLFLLLLASNISSEGLEKYNFQILSSDLLKIMKGRYILEGSALCDII
jgi:hypothetical protein